MSATTTDLIVTIKANIVDYGGLEAVISNMVAAVRDKDPATKQYNFSVDADRTTLFVMERYPDAAAFMAHTENMGPFAGAFFSKIEVTDSAIHVAPDVELPAEFRAALEPFGTEFRTLIGSFEAL